MAKQQQTEIDLLVQQFLAVKFGAQLMVVKKHKGAINRRDSAQEC